MKALRDRVVQQSTGSKKHKTKRSKSYCSTESFLDLRITSSYGCKNHEHTDSYESVDRSGRESNKLNIIVKQCEI